jgi:hypothetical protein
MIGFFYELDEQAGIGQHIITFKREVAERNSNTQFIKRLLALALCLSCYTTQLICFTWHGLLLYFTNWTLNVTTLFVLGSIFCSMDSNLDKSQWKLAITHLLFEAGLFMNIIVVIVYWGFLHKDGIGNFKGLEVVHMWMVHILPAISFSINHLTTDIVIYDDHAKGLCSVGIIYSVVNAYHTITTGVPLYAFLTWTDYKSPLICALIMIAFLLVFGSVAKVTRMMKPWM